MTAPWDQGQTHPIDCRHCGTHSLGQLVANHWFHDTIEIDGHEQPGPSWLYHVVACSSCTDLTLISQFQGEGDDEYVYPNRGRGATSEAVPASLRSSFEEASKCLNARAFTATAIMARRCLEGLCAEHSAKGGNLAVKLDALRQQGVLDQRLFDWCDELRLAGNDAAHEVGMNTSAIDARDALDLVEAVLDYVYVYQARYQAFKARRATPRSEGTAGLMAQSFSEPPF